MTADLMFARDYARVRQRWVVVVVPPEELDHTQKMLVGTLAPGDRFGGRTVLMAGGGKVSVAASTDPVFVPDGEAFHAMFLRWGKASGGEEMFKWRRASRSVVVRR